MSLLKKTNYNNKITAIENEVPSISGLSTNAALTVVENKIPSIRSLKKQIITQKLLKLKINWLILIMTSILLLQALTS